MGSIMENGFVGVNMEINDGSWLRDFIGQR
jgi:hypothetical protein